MVVNRCGECTVCCTVSVVEAIGKKAWETCKYCSNNSCDIYGDHPDQCKEFECAYLQSGTDNVELRPDKSNVMFFKKSERIFVGVVVPGKVATRTGIDQILSFNQQGYSVILLRQFGKLLIAPTTEHNPKDIRGEYLGILKEHGNV